MYLYLIQHAQAVTKEEDPSRCLSDKGIQDIRKVAAFLLKKDVEVDKIYHSGKMRSLQTAQILSDYLASDNILIQGEDLTPNDDPSIWHKRLSELDQNVMLVGHLPHLGNLLGLLAPETTEKPVEFENGIVICLKEEGGPWSIEWIAKPEMIG